jgi:iron complex outermembrane receptor protein
MNETIGKGSSNVDLDIIPLEAVDKVEILRDGAAAQYGSDAISGVINIKLKGAYQESRVSLHTGQRLEGDGRELYGSTFITIPLKYDGFFNLTLSAKSQGETQRAGADRRVNPPKVYTHAGVPESESFSSLINLEVPTYGDLLFYSNALINYRESSASAFFREPDENRTQFQDGFLPIINAEILNYSISAGFKGVMRNSIKWDLSNTYGYSNFHFFLHDSMNFDLDGESPTEFDNGQLSFIQTTTNLDFKKEFKNFNLAWGGEYRHEDYKVIAGDQYSYFKSGSQGFAGFMPEAEVIKERDSYALYLNSVYRFNKKTSIEGAGRHEHFTDFGQTTNLKLSLGHKFLPELLWRTSASTGFRAPSLAQASYSHASTFSSSHSDDLVYKGVVRPDHPFASALGIEELEPEKSTHITTGVVYQPVKELSIMFDLFHIKVYDRILLSDDKVIDKSCVEDIVDGMDIEEIRAFENASNSLTDGLDLKIDYHYELGNSSKLRHSFWYNHSRTRLANSEASGGLTQVNRVENGQPQHSIRFLTYYDVGDFETTLNIIRHSQFAQVMGDEVYNFSPVTLFDLDLGYRVSNGIRLALGGHNILDTYPDKWSRSDIRYGYDGIKPYSRYTPFGYSGGYYYLKVAAEF